MRQLIIFVICYLTSSTLIVFGQNPFLYKKGQGYESLEKDQMSEIMIPKDTDTILIKASSIPQNKQTIFFPINLPEYKSGVYFSRDNTPEDHSWPNNVNRLLTWKFDHLEDLTKDSYPGIPSNGTPSLLGDALLLQLANGDFLFLKAVSGKNSLSWLQISGHGNLIVNLSTLSLDNLQTDSPVLLSSKGKTAIMAIQNAYDLLIANPETSSLQKRTNKTYYEAFDYLGWCSWEHYHFDIDESKLLMDLKAINSSAVPIRYVLIDDGHVDSDKEQLVSFLPDKNKFPDQWKNIIACKKEDEIKWMGLWYNFCGYWKGISPENKLNETINKRLYLYNGSLLPGKSEDEIKAFYNTYVSTLKNFGFDFLKIDNQSFMLPLYMGDTDAIKKAKLCNIALEEATNREKVGLMNCMAQNILNTDHTTYSSVTRVSIDYKKYDEDMAKSHLFQSYTNTLLQGQTVWPDHDMFHSSDTICGELMARSKAMSGGPVYLSDSPDNFTVEYIYPLIDEQGRLFRPKAPAIPTPESIFMNPLQEKKSYRVFAPTGNEGLSLICYNLNADTTATSINAIIHKSDYDLRETFTRQEPIKKDKIILYDWILQTAEELVQEKVITLKGFTDRLFHLCPVSNGWGVIGIREKYLSPATVEIISSTNKELILNVLTVGTLCIWVESNEKNELRNIPITTPGRFIINK